MIPLVRRRGHNRALRWHMQDIDKLQFEQQNTGAEDSAPVLHFYSITVPSGLKRGSFSR